ncbi:MAG: hypothetical protein QXR76_03475 [Candidatus Bathyarchaeia archaeon]
MTGSEGLQVGVWGFQPNAAVLGAYDINTTLPSPFAWGQQPMDPSNALIRHVGSGDTAGTMLIETQKPYPETGLASREITYFVKVSENETHTVWKKVVGIVQPWTFVLQISLRPIAGEYYAWRNHAVWLGMGTVKWDRAYSDPDDPSKSSDAGWSIPLSAYIEEYNPYGSWTEDDGVTKKTPPAQWVAECCVLTPDYSGRTVTLYDDPNKGVTLDEIWYAGMQGQPYFKTLNETLSSELYPDTKFKNHVYFRIAFSDFRPYMEYNWGMLQAVWYPSVYYRIRVYYLSLGEFTYVLQKDEIPQWEERGWTQIFMPAYYLIDEICRTLNILNPFSAFGPYAGIVAFVFLIIIILAIIFVLLAIFAPWVLTKTAKATKDVTKTLKS